MKAITKFLAGGVAVAALAAAAPAAAQYFPGMGFPGYGSTYPGYGAPGYGMPGYGQYGYGVNSQAAVSQCTSAVQARLGGGYSYGYGNPYGGGGRVLGVSRVEQRGDGGLTVRGVAASGRGYYSTQAPDLTWRCRTDFRGFVVDIDVNAAQPAYGGYGTYGNNGYTPYNNYNNDYDYSEYGYQRY